MADLPYRHLREQEVRRAFKRTFLKFRKAAHNRQPPYAKMRTKLMKEVAPLLTKVKRMAAQNIFKKFAKGIDTSSFKLESHDEFTASLIEDLFDRSRQRWAAMKKPRKREEVLKWRKENLGDQRAAIIATTEVTRAQQFGEDAALAWLQRNSTKRIESYWRVEMNPCPLCEAMRDQPSTYWRQFYPLGPPSPHPVCRCSTEQVQISDLPTSAFFV